MLANASPLFEEKRDLLLSALAPDVHDPVLLHRPSMRSAFPSDDHPVDASEIQRTEILEERLDRQEPYNSGRVAKNRDPWYSVFPILNAHAKPHVREAAHPAQFGLEQAAHTLLAFRQHLINVPVSAAHGVAHRRDVLRRHTFVEQVAHRVDEDLPRSTPRERLLQLVVDHTQVEPVFERVSRDPAEALSERFRVTELATRTDLGASTHRVPGRVRPLNGRAVAHMANIRRITSASQRKSAEPMPPDSPSAD